MRKFQTKQWLPVVAVLLVALILFAGFLQSAQNGRVFPIEAESRLTGFLSGSTPSASDYDNLFSYFIEGFETFRIASGASANYPGLRSRNGDSADRLEGFSRLAPLFGVWIHSGRSPHITLIDGRVVDIRETFMRGLIAGTDPNSDDYWGDIQDLDQRIVEAADVALAVWLFRNDVWTRLNQSQKANVIIWLKQVEGRKVPDNNWHGFPALISAVLGSLGHQVDVDLAREHYERLTQFYRGGGWFSDGPDEIFDYYNAWSIHYTLQWLHVVDPTWDSEFIPRVFDEFLSTYRYLIGPNGFPMLGRSTCYRMAAPVPLILAQFKPNKVISPGEARRSLDTIWTYFIQRGAIRTGKVGQGYCGTDPRVLDNYSGPASCLWALRSLIAAFMLPQESHFWSDPVSPLPVEQSSYHVSIPEIGWNVIGDHVDAHIRILKSGVSPSPHLSEYGLLRRIGSGILWRPFRPDNHEAKYGGAEYDSSRPFCGCPM